MLNLNQMKKLAVFFLALLILLYSSTLPLSVAPVSAACTGDLVVSTGLGCLNAGDPAALIGQILGWAVVVGGGVAFLLIVYAGFQITTATGDPKKMHAANELLTAAVSGLILIVLSIVILNTIGVSILGLDRFGFSL